MADKMDVRTKELSEELVRPTSEDSINVAAVTDLADVVPPHESYEGYEYWDPAFEWSAAEERRVVWKTDLLLLTVLCLMFFGLQLDRGNLSNALTDNLLKDLGLTTNDYNNGTTIQLVCFLAAEFPIQLLVKRLGFRRVLPVMVMLWSTVSWAQAFMTDRSTFYATRALIGMCEGGFIPGTILFATYFYKSNELSVRLALFWSTLNVARVISALLAAGLLEMRGVAGKPGWFWLFLLEGILTFVIGLFAFLYLPQSPVDTKSVLCRKAWYSDREQRIMINRLLRDDPAKGLTGIKEPARLSDIWDALRDKSMWGLYFIGLVAYIPVSHTVRTDRGRNQLTPAAGHSRSSLLVVQSEDSRRLHYLGVESAYDRICCMPGHHDAASRKILRVLQRADLALLLRRILGFAAPCVSSRIT